MIPKELTDKAKEVIAKAEAKILVDKQHKELIEAVKAIKIESHITVNPLEVNVPKIDTPVIPTITMPEFPPIPKAEINITQEPIKIPKIEIPMEGVEKAIAKINLPKPEISVKIPPIKVPKPEVTVNVPAFPKLPKLTWPEGNMPIEGWVSLKGVDRKNPLSVELRDSEGKPLRFPEYVGGSGGGRSIARIGGVDASAFASYMNADNRLRVSVESGGSGLTDTELRASHLDVQQVSGAIDSVNVVSSITLETKQLSGSIDSVYVTGIFNSTTADVINADNRVRVSLEPGGSGLTDSELRATHLDVFQLSGSVNSVIVNDTLRALDIVQVSGSEFSVVVNNTLDVKQLSGAVDSVVSREIPDATSTYAPSNAFVTAYNYKLVVKANVGVLFALNGYNSSTSAQFIQLHNATSEPAGGATPEVIFRVPASSNFSYSSDKFGRYFSTGIVAINSSTAETLTHQAKDCWFDAQYS